MKFLLGLLVCLLTVFGASAEATTIEMTVNGLVCAFCAQGIEKTLREFPATTDVLVSFEYRLVAVAVKDGQDIPDAALRQALTNAGYSVKAINRTETPMADLRDRVRQGKP